MMNKCIRNTAVIVFGIALGACSVGPDYEKPEIAANESWMYSNDEMQDVINSQWWSQFGDPVLDELIDEALVSNRDVRIAAARVEQFAAGLKVARSDFFPQFGYGANRERQGISEARAAQVPGMLEFTDTYQATLNVGWELDIWGRVRRASEAARADLLAAEDTRRSVILTLVSSVATSYVSLRQLDRQLEIAIATRGSRGEALHLFELQFQGGVVGELQVEQIRSEYERAAAAVPVIERDIAQLENQISVLLGRNPGSIPRGKTIDKLALAPIPAGIPSELLIRRPDIRLAEQQLIAANARIGVARAAYFPSISLTGLAGFISADLDSWFESDSKAWAAGGSLAGPIFAGGRIKGNVKQAEALQKQSLFNYQQTILTAFKEVEDALIETQKAREKLVAEGRRVEALENYARLAKVRYDNGYTSYIEVLDSERSLFDAQLNYVATQNLVYVGLINTYKAMGGGWVTLAEQKANEVDFPEDEKGYKPDQEAAALYSAPLESLEEGE